MSHWPQTVAGLLFGALAALVARLLLRLVYDGAVYADRFNSPLFVIGTLVVTLLGVLAAAVSTPSAIGATATSVGSILAAWLGLRFGDAQAAGDRLGFLISELHSAFDGAYLDAGAVVLSGALAAVLVLRLRGLPTREG